MPSKNGAQSAAKRRHGHTPRARTSAPWPRSAKHRRGFDQRPASHRRNSRVNFARGPDLSSGTRSGEAERGSATKGNCPGDRPGRVRRHSSWTASAIGPFWPMGAVRRTAARCSGSQAGLPQRARGNVDVLAAVIGCYEPEALLGIEELDRAFDLGLRPAEAAAIAAEASDRRQLPPPPKRPPPPLTTAITAAAKRLGRQLPTAPAPPPPAGGAPSPSTPWTTATWGPSRPSAMSRTFFAPHTSGDGRTVPRPRREETHPATVRHLDEPKPFVALNHLTTAVTSRRYSPPPMRGG